MRLPQTRGLFVERVFIFNNAAYSTQTLLPQGCRQIGIYFEKDKAIELAVRKTKDIKWTQTYRCSYLPVKKENYQALVKNLEAFSNIDASLLKIFLKKRKEVEATLPRPASYKPLKPLSKTVAWNLSAENATALQKLVEQLKLKAYSPSTIRTYRNEFL